jgi:arylsulfatase A-like enzyme
MTRVTALILGLLLAAAIPHPERSSASSFQHVVVIVIDGARPDYLDLTPMPNLRRLMRDGTVYTRAWIGQMIANTPPVHATLATGTFPRTNGVIGFGWKDPSTGRMTWPTSMEAVMRGEQQRVLAAAGVPTIAGILRARRPGLVAASVSSSKYFAADAMGLEANYVIFRTRPSRGTVGPSAVPGREPPPGVLDAPSLRDPRNPSDAWATDAALALFRAVRPQVLLLNLPATDEQGHATGGIVAPEIMSRIVQIADVQIGRLLRAYEDAGILAQTLWVVTSDHGMVPGERLVDVAQLRKAAADAGARLMGGGGSSAEFWVDDTGKIEAAARAIAGVGLPGVSAVYRKVREGAGFAYHPVEVGPPVPGDLDAAYRYLFSTFAGAHGPEIAVPYRENTINRGDQPTDPTLPFRYRGSHGGVSWLIQHIPLVISGPGVRRGLVTDYPARVVDIAPTILALLGAAPTGMDGIVLGDAFETPSGGSRELQEAQAYRLRPLQDALIAASRRDRAGR